MKKLKVNTKHPTFNKVPVIGINLSLELHRDGNITSFKRDWGELIVMDENHPIVVDWIRRGLFTLEDYKPKEPKKDFKKEGE